MEHTKHNNMCLHGAKIPISLDWLNFRLDPYLFTLFSASNIITVHFSSIQFSSFLIRISQPGYHSYTLILISFSTTSTCVCWQRLPASARKQVLFTGIKMASISFLYHLPRRNPPQHEEGKLHKSRIDPSHHAFEVTSTPTNEKIL